MTASISPPWLDRSQNLSADCKIPDCSISVWIKKKYQFSCTIFPSPFSSSICVSMVQRSIIVGFVLFSLTLCWLNHQYHHLLQMKKPLIQLRKPSQPPSVYCYATEDDAHITIKCHEWPAAYSACLLLVVSFGVLAWDGGSVCVVFVRVVSCGVWHEVVMCVVLVASGLLWGLPWGGGNVCGAWLWLVAGQSVQWKQNNLISVSTVKTKHNLISVSVQQWKPNTTWFLSVYSSEHQTQLDFYQCMAVKT